MKIMRLTALAVVSLFLYIILISSNSSQAASTKTVQCSIKDTAPVTVKFDGLQALFFGDPNRVSVGILDAPHHTPQITITRVKGADKQIVATFKGDQLRRELYIDTIGSNTGIQKYQGNWPDDKNDLRWALNFNDLYKRYFRIKEEAFFGKIHFSSGLFYVNELTEMKYKFFSADGSGKAMDFYRQIGYVAAKINLNTGDLIVIKSADNELNIKLPYDGYSIYEMTLSNLPPPDHGNLDHFLYYYEILEDLAIEKYFPVEFSKTAGPRPVMCTTVIFE